MGDGQRKPGRTKRTHSPPTPYSQSPIAHRQSAAHAALIIFAKAPIPGTVKTRLCPPLTDEEAATLHGSLVLDVLERTQMPSLDRFMACAPSAEHVFFKILEERHRVRLLAQHEGDLGNRMHEAFRTVLTAGYGKALLIGTDVPAISRALLAKAQELLGSHDVVLGPAVDGGYYLIGLTRLVPELFANMPWSSNRVCAMTEEKASSLQLKVAVLPPHRDLDTVQDLLAMASEFGQRHESRGKGQKESLSKRTEDVLRTLAERIHIRHATAISGS